jgi:hypothetical protein
MNDSISLPDASRPATLASSLSTTTALSSPALSPDNASPPTRRGRKSETPAQRLERLQRAVADARIAAKEAERRMFAVVGEALLAEAEADAQLRARMLDILRRRATGAQARADIATLLAG